MTVAIGELLQNKYRIVRLIGQGGMGAVYEGQNESIARRVAIKVLHGGLASQQGVAERFEREAQAAGRIGNDHILEVLDIGAFPDGDRFMIMEYLDGETLEERLQSLGVVTPHEVYPIVRQLLVGLSAAHDAGIIHRDLKPDNVFVLREKAGQPDFVKIIDFGISKFTTLVSDMRMTATGAVMGTPYFMAPEQAKGSRDADVRSDLYSVGVILFKAVTGTVPFDAASFNELLFKIVLSETPRASALQPTLDPDFDGIIYRAMARDPAMRFQSSAQFIRALDDWYASARSVRSSGELSVRRERDNPLQWSATAQVPSGIGGETSASKLDAAFETEWGKSVAVPGVPSNRNLLMALGAGAGLVLFAVALFIVMRPSRSVAEETVQSTALPAAAPPVASVAPQLTAQVPALPAQSPSLQALPAVSTAPVVVEALEKPEKETAVHESGSSKSGTSNWRRPARGVAAPATPVAAQPVAVQPPPPQPPRPRPSTTWDYDY